MSRPTDEIPTDLITTPQDAVMALCRLSSEVLEHLEYTSCADCFCGERQSWVENGTWRNEGETIRFIIDATQAVMARERADRKADE